MNKVIDIDGIFKSEQWYRLTKWSKWHLQNVYSKLPIWTVLLAIPLFTMYYTMPIKTGRQQQIKSSKNHENQRSRKNSYIHNIMEPYQTVHGKVWRVWTWDNVVRRWLHCQNLRHHIGKLIFWKKKRDIALGWHIIRMSEDKETSWRRMDLWFLCKISISNDVDNMEFGKRYPLPNYMMTNKSLLPMEKPNSMKS